MKNRLYPISLVFILLSVVCVSCQKENMQAPNNSKVKGLNTGKVSSSGGATDYLDPLYNPPYTPPSGCPASKH
jgi:hypothetical protein